MFKIHKKIKKCTKNMLNIVHKGKIKYYYMKRLTRNKISYRIQDVMKIHMYSHQ